MEGWINEWMVWEKIYWVVDFFGKMLNWENLKITRPLLGKKELGEGKQRITYHLCDLYKFLHFSETLFLYLEKREIKFYLPGRAL